MRRVIPAPYYETQMSQISNYPNVPDVSRTLTTGKFEKAIRGNLERAAEQYAAPVHPTKPGPRLSLAALLARLRRFVAHGAGAVRAQTRQWRR